MSSRWPSPAELFGDLLHEVQTRRLFADGKYFVDMEPRHDPREIMSRYRSLDWHDNAALAAFVAQHFDPPRGARLALCNHGAQKPLVEHIRMTWDHLVRPPLLAAAFSSAVPLHAPYVVPGGRFRESYYWDSYFTMLGLRADGRDDLVEATIENCTSLIERFGFVPNGSRSYYLGRSQPPVFYLMLELSNADSPAVRQRRLDALLAEHSFWMKGSQALHPGEARHRVVCMPDGSLLNRYWDESDRPRDESYAEDLMTAQSSECRAQVFRNLRAAAESGWDFSSRWFGDEAGLASTRTVSVAPIDLNCLLYGLEQAIARRARELAALEMAVRFEAFAERRRRALQTYCWSEPEQRFGDCLWSNSVMTASINAAALFPLFNGIASSAQADATATLVRRHLLAPGGMRCTTVQTGEQWDMPNGWAPLQWIAVIGLLRYGHKDLACSIATRWISTVKRDYEDFGLLFEKYDIENRIPGRGGEYPVQSGFGWTNGVTRALLQEESLASCYDGIRSATAAP